MRMWAASQAPGMAPQASVELVRSDARFVVKVPLRTNARDDAILTQRLRARQMLKNTALVAVRARARQMRRDPRYREAAQMASGPARTRAFRELLAEYRLRPFDVNNTVQEHWRASKWMPLVLHTAINDALAKEIHGEVQRWLVGLTAEPRPQALDDAQSIWGRNKDAGLQWSEKKQALVYPRAGKNAPKASREAYPEFEHSRKGLVLRFARRHGPGSHYWQQRVGQRRIARVGVKRELTRRGWVWFALLTVEGVPYRNPERSKLIERNAGKLVGVDLNVSSVAVVGEGTAELLPLIEPAQLEAAKADAARQRRRKRAFERSLRAVNPHAFDGRGRRRRGERVAKRSKRAQRLQREMATESRRAQLNREREQRRIAKRILVRHGTELVHEKVAVRSWRGRWGKRIALTNPARAMQLIIEEALRHGGSSMPLSVRLGLSSTCLCGQRLDKGLSRAHACNECGLGLGHPLDRNLFSSLLARLVGQLGEESFCAAVREGTLADEHRRLSGAPELSDRELSALRMLRVPSPSPRRKAGKHETAQALRGGGTPDSSEVRVLDGLPVGCAPDKVAHSGSKLSVQTDGTTPLALLGAPAGSSGRRMTSGPTAPQQGAFAMAGGYRSFWRSDAQNER
jgi:hypothetical protein